MDTSSPAVGTFKYEEVVVAAELNTPVCAELAKAVTALRRAANPLQMQLFWIAPSLAHVSLLYTARVREDLLPLVIDAVGMVAGDSQPITARIRGLKLFEETKGGETTVKAIWAMVTDGADGLANIRAGIRKALSELQVDTDGVEFLPHVPLALVDQFKSAREFGSAFVEWQEKDFGEVQVRNLVIKRVTPAASGEKPFTVLADVPLGGGGGNA